MTAVIKSSGLVYSASRFGRAWLGIILLWAVMVPLGSALAQPAVPGNLLTYSSDFRGPSWYWAGAAGVTADTATAPDGSATADTLTFAPGNHPVFQQIGVSVANDERLSCSAYVKQVTAADVWLQCFIPGTPHQDGYAVLNFSTGLATAAGAAAAQITPSVEALSGGWYRLVATLQNVNPSANTARISLATSNGSFHAWGAQMVKGSDPGVYMPTVGSPAGPVAGRTSSWTYDGATGLLTSETIEPGNSQLELKTSYTYDAFGNKTVATVSSTVSGYAGITTRSSTTSYSSDGRFVVTATNALSHSETRVNDVRFGGVTSQTGPNGLTTTWSYDSFGRKVLETRPDGTKTKWEYLWCSGVNGGSASCPSVSAPGTHSAAARYVAVTTPLASDGTTVIGAVEKIYFDVLERELRRESQGYNTDSQPARAVYLDTVYNDRGQVWKKSRPYFPGDTAVWTSFTYDALGRPVQEDRPNGTVTVQYAGLVNTVTNEWNESRVTTKNSQGQVVHVKNGRHDSSTAVYSINTYTYDPFGNLLTVKDADTGQAGNVTSFSYDGRGRKVAMSDPDKGSWTYGYDVLGQLKYQTDAKGQTTNMAYDLLGRMTGRSSYRPGSVQDQQSWEYDTAPYGIGKLNIAWAVVGSTPGFYKQYGYDSLGRPNVYQEAHGGGWLGYTMQYDNNSRLSTQTYPSGLQLGYEYTDIGELKWVQDTASSAYYWTLTGRNAAGQLTGEELGNGVTTARSYDTGRGLVTGIQTVKSGTTLQQWSIGYDSVGNVTSRSEGATGVSEAFTYDPLNRLLTATTVSSSVNYTVSMQYDGNNGSSQPQSGNIHHKSDLGTYSYPATGQARPHAVTSITGPGGTKSFSYDANGNMLTGDGRSYTWSPFDHPLSISRGSETVSFDYGTEHQRFRQTTSAGMTEYYTNAATGARSERALTLANAHVRWTDYVAAGNGIALTVSTTDTSYTHSSVNVTRSYLHRDHLGSTTLVTDAAGVVIQRMAYDPWGKRRNTNGTADPTGALEASGLPNRGFTDHEHLEELGLVHMNGRLYDPTIARMVSADPLVDDPFSTQALNRYSYVGNNPLTYTDPTGYLKLGRLFQSLVRTVVAYVVGTVACGGNPACGAILAGAVNGYAQDKSFKGALIGAINGAVSYGIGSMMPVYDAAGVFQPQNLIPNAALHAARACASAEAMGGRCGPAAAAAFTSSMLGPLSDHLVSLTGVEGVAQAGAELIGRGVVGGIASKVAGGEFEDGFAEGVFEGVTNALSNKIGRWLNSNTKYAKFFSSQYKIVENLAKELSVDVSFLLGLSAYESGWGTSSFYLNNNNPFGATPNGRDSLIYSSLDKAWEDFAKTWGGRIKGVGSDVDAFILNLSLDNRSVYGPTIGGDFRGSYNSVNTVWSSTLRGVIQSVQSRLSSWWGNPNIPSP
ncbi:phage head spike fiber domain-containing protein [Ferrovibrio sp.]|uniref:phage head spike fiber domain-containing protein n=1 Tax=Ferrovibrio sp. TaxID=1917215 RepID=UPI003D139E14